MNGDLRRSNARALLRAEGAATLEHPGGTLLEHSERVAAVLGEWGSSEDAQLAGLCHAAYGTDGYGTAFMGLDDRLSLAAIIGDPSERLVYLYGCCDRSMVYPQFGQASVRWHDRFTTASVDVDGETLRSLVQITVANELDVIRHSAELASKYGGALDDLVERTRRHLPAEASIAWRAARFSSEPPSAS